MKRALRSQVMNFLGDKCSCCGESTARFLTLDHAKDDGTKERLASQQITLMRAVLRGERPDIRILCFNCNCGRQLNGGVCPHEATRQSLCA